MVDTLFYNLFFALGELDLLTSTQFCSTLINLYNFFCYLCGSWGKLIARQTVTTRQFPHPLLLFKLPTPVHDRFVLQVGHFNIQTLLHEEC